VLLESDGAVEDATGGEHRPVTIENVRSEARTAGRTGELVRHERFTMDVCPACTGLKGAPRPPEVLSMS
jgi:hypothetical protein